VQVGILNGSNFNVCYISLKATIFATQKRKRTLDFFGEEQIIPLSRLRA